ncbi:MAG: alpha/beta hydrolase, partial [Oscillospiraceae bacterium]
TGYEVLSFEYRLSPEHPYPAALEDATRAWDYLMHQGYGARDVMIAGDSAGGNLALCLTQKLKAEGRRLPMALILLSPWTDLSASGSSYTENVELDPMISPAYISAVRSAFAGHRTDFENPALSPLFGDFEGFPPVLIQAGTNEILLSDSVRLRDRLIVQGVPCRLEVWKNMWHVFQMFPLRQAAEAMDSIGRFLLELF